MSLPTVIDVGSCVIRAGSANPEEPPPVVTPACARDGASSRGAGGGLGPSVAALRRGSVASIDALEAVLEYALYDQLGWEYGDEGNVLLAEPLMTSKAQREDLCQLMFEVFSVRGLFVEAQATLALYACNKLTGVAVDCGHGTCDVAPVVDGVVQHAAAQRLMYGGEDVTRRLGRDVAAEGDARLGGAEAFETHDEGGGPPLAPALAAAQELKELCARVAPTRAAYLAAMGAAPSAQAAAAPGGQDGGQGVGTPETFSLPDGRSFTVGERTRLTAGEALFDPSLLGMASDLSLPQAVCQAVGACGAESRKALWEAIVPCGGSTQAAGFVERLRTECAELAPMSCPAGIVRHAEYMPAGSVRHASWLGGAILAKIVFAQNHHMTKYEYDEVGPHAIHRKAGL